MKTETFCQNKFFSKVEMAVYSSSFNLPYKGFFVVGNAVFSLFYLGYQKFSNKKHKYVVILERL